MELKKSKKADLEVFKGVFLQIGLILVLSAVLLAFESNNEPTDEKDYLYLNSQPLDLEELMPVIRQEIIPLKPRGIDNITFVPDDTPIEIEIDFNVEIKPESDINYPDFIDDIETDEEAVRFLPIEDMPKFNGGDPSVEFRKYISQNTIYPTIAAENGVKGRVIVQFVINKKGELVDAEVLRSVDPALDKEALRVLLSSPTWTPGKQRNKPVNVIYVFPIAFDLK